jgi:hypothetical protein
MSRSRPSFQSCITPIIESLESRRLRSADLSAAFSSAIPAELSAADNNHVAIRVVDDGDASAAGKVGVSLYLSPEAGSVTGDDVLLAATTKALNLKPGHGRNIGFRFAEPAAAADGNYSLFADVNSGAIADASSTDQIVTAQSSVVVNQPKPDLTPLSIEAPTDPIVISDSGTLGRVARATIANRGKGTADGDVTIQFYLSNDSRLDSGDTLAATIESTPVALKPGQREHFSALLVPDSQTPGGNYFLLAVVTPGKGIVQQNPADEIGVAPKQVLVVREISTIPPENQGDDVNDQGSTIIDNSNDDSSSTPIPSDGAPTNTPPSTQPSTQPATQPTTQPCDSGSGCDTGSTGQSSRDDPSNPPDDSGSTDDMPPQDDSGDQTAPDNNSDSSNSSDSSDAGSSSDGGNSSDAGDSSNSSNDSSSSSTDDSQSGSDSNNSVDDSGQSDNSGQDDSSSDTSSDSGDDSSFDWTGDDGD